MTNRKYTLLAASVFAIALLLVLSPAHSGEPSKPDDSATAEAGPVAEDEQSVLVLDAITSATPRYRPMVWKTHAAHAERVAGNCRRCHHDLRGSNVTPGRCANCHSAAVEDMTLAEAWHGLCRDCHINRQLANKPKQGPVKCLGCHQERE